MSLNFETAPGGYGVGSRNPYDQQGRGFDPKWDGGTNFKRRLYKGQRFNFGFVWKIDAKKYCLGFDLKPLSTVMFWYC